MARLYKRGPIWYCDLCIGGKRVRRPLSPNKAVAEEKLARLVQDRTAARYGYGSHDMPWSHATQKYLDWSKSNRSPITHRHNARALAEVERLLRPRTLLDVTPERLERLKADLRARGLKDESVNRAVRAVKTAMRKMEAWNGLTPRRWDLVEQFKVPPGRMVYFTMEELRRLLEACRKPHWRTIVLLGARAGLRAGEIYHLEWQDVDFHNNRLNVAPKADWQPKGGSRRQVPMSPDLRAHLEVQKARAEGPHVVSEPGGWRPASESSMGNVFKKVLRKAKLGGFLHVLRHTFGSHLAIAGVPLATIRDLMGHRSIRTTEIYAHLSPESLQDGVSRLPKL